MSKSSLYLDKTLKEMVVRGVWAEDGRGGGGDMLIFNEVFKNLVNPTNSFSYFDHIFATRS